MRLGRELLEDRPGSVGVPHPNEATPEHVARTEVPFKLQLQLLFDLDATLEETWRDLDVVRLGLSHVCGHLSYERGIPGGLGLRKRGPRIGEASGSVRRDQLMTGANRKNPGGAGIVVSAGLEGQIALLDQLACAALLRERELEDDIGTFDARGDFLH
jgi:hypothetical protein